MKKLLLLSLALFFIINAFGQNFFDTDFNQRKKYIILCNPTVYRIKNIQYLTNAKLLNVKTNKVKFVGVYYEGEKQDYNESIQYIKENNLDNFFLHEIKGELNANNLYQNNDVSEQLKIVFNNSIGVIFFGGADIPPALYNKENTRSAVYTPGRHYFEATFLFHLLGGFQDESIKPFLSERPDYLVTGFCLGMQTMNIATGGTLIQDIPAEIYGAENAEETVKIGRINMHRNYWQKLKKDTLLMGINLHTVQFTNHPFFTDKIGMKQSSTPRIFSSHHQAVEKLGKGMEITCLSPDGKVIEGLAHKVYPNVFAVQFHPEVPALYEDMGLKKFHPDDKPMSYHDIIGKASVHFHKQYWGYISRVLKRVKKPKK